MTRPGVVGGALGYRILRALHADGSGDGWCDGRRYRTASKLEVLFGPQFWSWVRDREVLDFGCGVGEEVIAMALHGARRVVGIDIRPRVLELGRAAAARAGVADRCRFAERADAPVDVVLSLDGFEHYADPAGVLEEMRRLVRADGRVLVCFGPPWYHPLGGHLFSVFPWAHLLFSEAALIRWRADFKHDGATRFGEVEGGLNQMTVRRFERLVAASPFRFERFEAVPIRRLRWLANPLTREFTTAVVRCTLVPRT